VSAEDVFNVYKDNIDLKPIEIKISGISLFKNPDFDVVKFDVVKSETLSKANELMKELPNTSTFPEYHPHITIAYLTKDSGEKYMLKNLKIIESYWEMNWYTHGKDIKVERVVKY
jgi:2'-5' RNA ligase